MDPKILSSEEKIYDWVTHEIVKKTKVLINLPGLLLRARPTKGQAKIVDCKEKNKRTGKVDWSARLDWVF